MNELNIARIIGNTVVAFATTAIAINIAGEPTLIAAAFYSAFMVALLAFGKEMQDEGKNECGPEGKLNKLLLF